MSKPTVYCNADVCGNWRELDEVHHRDYGPNYKPIGNTGQYRGRCSMIPFFDYVRVRSSGGTEQEVGVCGSYNSNGDFSVVKDIRQLINDPAWNIDGAKLTFDGNCNVRPCLYNDAEHNSCIKQHDELDRYVDVKTLRNRNNKKEMAVCNSFSNRGIKGHIDMTKFGFATD